MVDLGKLGGSSSWGLAINGNGIVVGYGTTKANAYHAFISTHGGRMKDLNKLIWINTAGQFHSETLAARSAARDGARRVSERDVSASNQWATEPLPPARARDPIN